MGQIVQKRIVKNRVVLGQFTQSRIVEGLLARTKLSEY